MTFPAFSQTASQLEKAFNDPKRAENAAKADVYIHRKPIINDSIQASDVTTTTAPQKKRNHKRKASRS